MPIHKTDALIFSETTKSHKHKKHHPFTLKQNACALIDTAGIPPNGKASIEIAGSMTIVIYQAFMSPQAMDVWMPTLKDKNYFPDAMNPAKMSLIVFTNASGQVEDMKAFRMGTRFSLSNSINPEGGSEYFLATHVQGMSFPLLYMNIISPTTTVVIPSNLYAGPGKDCINMGYQPTPLTSNGFDLNTKENCFKHR